MGLPSEARCKLTWSTSSLDKSNRAARQSPALSATCMAAEHPLEPDPRLEGVSRPHTLRSSPLKKSNNLNFQVVWEPNLMHAGLESSKNIGNPLGSHHQTPLDSRPRSSLLDTSSEKNAASAAPTSSILTRAGCSKHVFEVIFIEIIEIFIDVHRFHGPSQYS